MLKSNHHLNINKTALEQRFPTTGMGPRAKTWRRSTQDQKNYKIGIFVTVLMPHGTKNICCFKFGPNDGRSQISNVWILGICNFWTAYIHLFNLITLLTSCNITYTCHQIPKWKKFGHFEVFDDNNFCIFSATHMDTFRYEIYFGWLEGGRGNTWCHYSGGMSECE